MGQSSSSSASKNQKTEKLDDIQKAVNDVQDVKSVNIKSGQDMFSYAHEHTHTPTPPNIKTTNIKIQSLPLGTRDYTRTVHETSARDWWAGMKCRHRRDECGCSVLCYMETCPQNVLSHPNGFFGAFANAYNNHEDIILSPDDVFIVVSLMFSKYVEENAEKLRDKFVSHDGKKQLRVETSAGESENQWDGFFDKMIGEIRKNTKEGVVEEMACNFSTTGKFETIFSTAIMMNSFKNYFDYVRAAVMCGINNIKFMGTLDDWEKVYAKTAALEKYAVDAYWANYVANMERILRKFIDTYKGEVDVDFWNKVMNIKEGRQGSGRTQYVSGWILDFFGLSGEVDPGNVKLPCINVPVTLVDETTGVTKNLSIVGGFCGVSKIGSAYRSQMSMIVHHEVKKKSMSAKEKDIDLLTS